MSMQKKSLAILLALATASAALAQDGRPVAFVNARIVPITGDVIERGTLVVKNGKIEALGADVATPPGARVVDASGKTILPGLVSACNAASHGSPSRTAIAACSGSSSAATTGASVLIDMSVQPASQ